MVASSPLHPRRPGRGWRIVASTSSSGFAWDVVRLRFQSGDTEETGEATDSGHVNESFRAKYAFRDKSLWGGRPEDGGKFHIGLCNTSGLPLTHIVLEQGIDHWVKALTVEQLTDDGLWTPFAQVTGLAPGVNTINLVDAPQADRPRVRLLTRDPLADRRIMVAVASYRDPELPRTVLSAIQQAAYPEHLRFVICHQFDEAGRDLLAPFADDPRFSIDTVPYTESRGCCWARARTFDRYNGEPYLLQIDAHTRFAPRWDERFIEMLESIDAELPLLTTYPPAYTLDEDGHVVYNVEAGLQKLVIRELRPDLTTLQMTNPVVDPSTPGRSPTLGAGQIFTRGRFCVDVPYDPNIYFGGEEISLAARAFTHGYDLFYPNQTLVWHLYGHDHAKHWEDHDDHGAVNTEAMERLHTLFRGDSSKLGRYGLGTVRTLAQFERAARVRLTGNELQPEHGLGISIDRSAIRPRDDYDHFRVVFVDGDGNEVASRSIYAPDVLDLSRAHVEFHDLDRERTDTYLLFPVQRNGNVGTPVRHQLGAR